MHTFTDQIHDLSMTTTAADLSRDLERSRELVHRAVFGAMSKPNVEGCRDCTTTDEFCLRCVANRLSAARYGHLSPAKIKSQCAGVNHGTEPLGTTSGVAVSDGGAALAQKQNTGTGHMAERETDF